MMKVSKTLMNVLHRLTNGETVAASMLRKDIADLLYTEGLLTVRTQGSRRSFSAIDPKALQNFLLAEFGYWDEESAFNEGKYQTRAEQASISGNSKLAPIRSCPGFPVNSYEPIGCMLNGNEFVIEPQEGSFVFITDWTMFVVPEDVMIVGIENMENFRMIRRQRKLFETAFGNSRLLFVSRYPQSTDLRTWLQATPNSYIHFGDFDLAGIHIFLTEFYQHLGNRASFFIPEDLEDRLKTGSMERYNLQYPRFHHLKTSISYLQDLINMINKYHRCYDQEGYIELK